MSQRYEKLKALLKELFQLDQPDLDFGFYRIMHAKSAEVNAFLDRDLLPQIKTAFAAYRSADKAEMEKELAGAIEQAKNLGVDPDTVRRVIELREKLQNESVDVAALESEVYDRLYNFFRRYYTEGDFLSKRVYKEGVYAIPYEGEEVKLYWANHDQYYIKTSEYLRDYAFRLQPDNENNPMRVHFRLVDAAEGEHGNVKEAAGKERRFKLAEDNTVSLEKGELVIRFTYEQESEKQKDLNNDAEETILKITDTALYSWIAALGTKYLRADGAQSENTRLRVHLDRYTARNTFDYFIHKDLGGFLRRELDFYIKNEVMQLDDIENETAPRVEQYLSQIKVIRKIAGKIIDFLAQLENFQKKLWLKKKFVYETNYCITLDRVPEDLYPEIVANEAQCDEWIKLFAIDEIQADLHNPGFSRPLTAEFLEANNKLMLDTRFYSEDFKARMLASIDDFDEQCDGLLIHSENFQALNSLSLKYKSMLSGIYIDPPYNTDATEIVYKNGYKDSTWCSLIFDRIIAASNLLSPNAVTCTTIDECELNNLSFLLTQAMPEYSLRPIVIEYNHRGRVKSNFAVTHEYALWSILKGKDLITRKRETADDIQRNLRRTGTDSTRQSSPKQFYGIEVDNNTLDILAVTDSLPIGQDIPQHTNPKTTMVWPVDDQGIQRRWYYGSDRVIKEALEGSIWAKKIKGKIQIHYHQDGKPKMRKSVWVGKTLDASTYGSELLNDLFGLGKSEFSFPKSIYATQECVESITYNNNALLLDYFAGSGTTGHAVINLNREDGGKRKYILVEMADYFDTVLKPRIAKVAYSENWKDGKPTARHTGISHCFKYIRLESYEDTLNNLELRRSAEQELTLFSQSTPQDFREQYMLNYMLDVESQNSLLNLQSFAEPMNYQLKIKKPGSDESRLLNVDLIETFNWLIGLTVAHIAAPQAFYAQFERDSEGRLRTSGRLKQDKAGRWWFRRVEGVTPDGRKTLIVWRNLTGNLEEDNLVLDTYMSEKLKISTRDFEFDLIYVNGSNNLENLRMRDNNWKVRLIEVDFHRLMFEAEGS